MANYTTDFDSVLRTWSYFAALFVLGATKLLGGSWVGFVIGIVIVHFTYRLLRGDFSKISFVKQWLAAIRLIHSWSLPVRFICVILLVGGNVAADVYFGGFNLGREFNLYLTPIFFSSLFFGGGITVWTWLFCLLAVYYFDIPPRYSFAIDSVQGILHLVVFIILCGIVFVIPKLLLASAELANAKREWSTRG
jgi:K+-sensing histidine kinase KdpD